jgi:polyisoprenoid-binding protein YceI
MRNAAMGLALLGTLIASPVALAASDTWTIDAAHSELRFGVKHMLISTVHGSFRKVSGQAKYDGKHLLNATISATIDTASVDTGEPKRDEHLRSADFLDAAKYPSITFVSRQVQKKARGAFAVTGDLTLHGVSRPVTLVVDPLSPAIKDPGGKTRMGTSATASLNRKDFGVSFNKLMDNGGAVVADQVDVTINVELVQEK